MSTAAYTRRLVSVTRALDRLGWSRKEAAKRIGKPTRGGAVYVSRVLRGESTSVPVVKALEEAIGEAEKATPAPSPVRRQRPAPLPTPVAEGAAE